eukprot:bmy_21530T0
MNRLQDDYDPYAVEEPSDEEPALSSSEDEVDVLLHGTPDQKRKLIRECLTGESESSNEDEFEKEMEAELNSTIKTMEDKHESYKTQYRAMFVMNCSINKEEILRYKTPENRKKRRGHKKMRSNQEDAAEQAETDVEEIYHPVMCTECSTEVAVYDKDEVFHFFNVLASHS